jgi:anti-sigma regulatory factor (Ser/Thr protein kinase)
VAPTLSVTILNRLDDLDRLFSAVDGFVAEHHLSDDDAYLIHLVLDEIVVNVIRHGFDDDRDHEIRVTLAIDAEDALSIRVEDEGRPFNPLDRPPPDLTVPVEERPIGGLGIFITRQTVDEMTYRREDDRNILTMRKKLTR